jgi:hypothetical protein
MGWRGDRPMLTVIKSPKLFIKSVDILLWLLVRALAAKKSLNLIFKLAPTERPS